MARHCPRAPKRVVSLGKVCEVAPPLEGKKQVSGSGKVVERDPSWSWPCEQLKLPQRRRRNHEIGDSELQ
jgi:hypothetical protein